MSLEVILCKPVLIPTRDGITKRTPRWALPDILLWKHMESVGFALGFTFFSDKDNLFLKEMIYWRICKWD